jgi:hypothetical protein
MEYPLLFGRMTMFIFPATYEGSEWVGSVPRNPNGKATKHIGGE